MALLPLLFGDDTRVAILRLLARTPGGTTQRRLAARIGRAPSHVNRVIQALQATGLVTVSDGNVRLDPDNALYGAVVGTLERFDGFEGFGRYLRVVIRAAKSRFAGRFYVGGYVAATRNLQPIDFSSDRCDLYVKGLTTQDKEWLKGLRHVSPYDLRLHPTPRIRGYVDEDATVDDEPCLVAYPEVGVLQCLDDDTFPRYGAFLLLVQGLGEWAQGEAGLQPQRLVGAGDATRRWKVDEVRRLVDYIQGRRKTAVETLTPEERRELANAIDTVRGRA